MFWPATGLLVGIGFLCKYTNAFELVSIVLILALVSIDGGLNLMGSPLSFSSIGEALISPSLRSPTASAASATADVNNVVTIQVQPHGYQPNRIRARAGTPAKLKLVTNRSYG